MNNSGSLPFLNNTDDIDQWLTTLSKKEASYAINELYKVLKTINKQNYEAKSLFNIIDQLTPAVLHFTHLLEAFFHSENNELDAKQKKITRLGNNSLRYLALAYGNSVSNEATNEQIILSTCRAMHIAGLNMKLSAMIYERFSTTLWEQISKLYSLALSRNILDHVFEESLSTLKNNNSINSTLKKIILFSICNPNSFTPLQINQIYLFAVQYSDFLKLKVHYNSNAEKIGYYWSYTALAAPNYMQTDANLLSILHINTKELLNRIHSSNFHYPFTDFEKIIFRLSAYQEIIHSRAPSEPKICNLICGFDQLFSHLIKQKQRGFLLNMNYETELSPDSSIENLHLEPLPGNGEQKLQGDETNIWNEKITKSHTHTIKIHKANNKNYVIAEINQMCCKVNEPSLLLYGDKVINLGIVRLIQNPQNQDVYRLLIQTWEGKIGYVKFKNKMTSGALILITKKDHSTEVLLEPGKYSSGYTVKTDTGDLMLNQLLEETLEYMHFTVTLC